LATAPLKILAIAATPFFVDRGGHIHIYEPIRALQAAGHQVTLVTYHLGRDVPGLEIRRIRQIPWYTKTDAGPSYHKLYLALLLFFKTLALIREQKPDILHAHGWDSLWIAWWAHLIYRTPYIFDMQGSFAGEIAEHGYAPHKGPYFRFLSLLEGLSLRTAPLILTSSGQIRDEALARFALPPEKIIVMGDGVDTEKFSPQACPPEPEFARQLGLPADTPLIVFMGLLKSYQGADDMLEAARILRYERGHEAFHFLVIGFPDEDHYRAKAASLGIGDKFLFVGKVPYQDTGRYLALADLAIAPKISMTEGDGKIYNYMALGLPVVAYERPASREILGDLGLYAVYHDPADLARALHQALSNPAALRERGQANRAKAVRDYSWEAVASRILSAYQRVLAPMHSSSEVPPPRPRSKSLWQALRLLMGLLGLLALISVVSPAEVMAAFRQADWHYLLPAWALMMISMGLKTERWRQLTQGHGLNFSFLHLFGTYLIGTFYSQFLPGSSAGGDAMRMAESSVDSGRAVDAVSSVVIERAVGLTSIVTTASLVLLLDHPADVPGPVVRLINLLSVLGISGLLILRFGWFVGPITQLLGRFGLSKIGRKIGELSAAFQQDLGNLEVLARMVVFSLLANACSMTAYYLALLALTEAVPYWSFISIVTLIITLEIIPLTPGSLGVREGAYVFFLGFLGIARPEALGIGLLIRALAWTQALMGGGILLYRAFNPSARPASQASEVGG
jgi:uncharacterized protein (TIRG00374 family)